MTVDVALATLKLLGILSAGAWGVIGLLVDYKREGVITPWGRRALIGTVFSTMVAVVAQSVETYKQKAENKLAESRRVEESKAAESRRVEENRRTEVLLHQIERSISPFKEDIRLAVDFSFPTSSPIAAKYVQRLKRLFPQRSSIYIRGNLLPDSNDLSEEELAIALYTADLWVWIFKTQPKITSAQELAKALLASDLDLLSLGVGKTIRNAETIDGNAQNLFSCAVQGPPCALMTYEERLGELTVEAKNFTPVFRKNTGQFKSLVDFAEATVLVQVPGPELRGIDVRIVHLTLKTPEGRELVLAARV